MQTPVESRPRKSPLLEETRQLMRAKHMSIRTEEAYLRWIEQFLRFHKEMDGTWVHPAAMADAEINRFLTHLAVERKVSASTQNQAFSALLFLYKQVLKKDVKIDAVRAKTPGFRLETRPRTGRKLAQQLAIKARVNSQTLGDGQHDLPMDTTCRWATGAHTSSATCVAVSNVRFLVAGGARATLLAGEGHEHLVVAVGAAPEAKPKEIAAKLKKYGITATYVSNIKGKMDLNAEMQNGATASTGNAVGRPATATNSLDAAIKFVEQSGGLKAAKAAIEKIERIKSL